MKNAMTRAHEIRKEAAAKWNCKVSEILFNICLEMAWAEIKENKMENFTDAQLRAKAKQYDNINNEGGEGFNPYRSEIERRQFEYEKNREKSLDEQKYDLLKKINTLDCSIARECGTYDPKEIATLRAQVDEIEAKQNADFLKEWPLDVTKARRIEWNDFVRSAMGDSKKVTPKIMSAINEKQREQRWFLNDLKRAVKLHNL